MASRSKVLYVGSTSDLLRRVSEHKEGTFGGFTSRYNVTRLVYLEMTDDPMAAFRRERQIKGWVRKRKVELIESTNPEWTDLSEEWLREGHYYPEKEQ